MDINAEVMNARLSSCRVYSQFIDAVCVMKFLFSSLFTGSSKGGISIHLICFNYRRGGSNVGHGGYSFILVGSLINIVQSENFDCRSYVET